MNDTESGDLRAEIERLLAAALRTEQRHEAEMKRRDQLHIAETDRRDASIRRR